MLHSWLFVHEKGGCWNADAAPPVHLPPFFSSFHRWLREEVHKGDKPLADSIVQRLQRFGTYGRLKQAALHTVRGQPAACRRQAGASCAGQHPGPDPRRKSFNGHVTKPCIPPRWPRCCR